MTEPAPLSARHLSVAVIAIAAVFGVLWLWLFANPAGELTQTKQQNHAFQRQIALLKQELRNAEGQLAQNDSQLGSEKQQLAEQSQAVTDYQTAQQSADVVINQLSQDLHRRHINRAVLGQYAVMVSSQPNGSHYTFHLIPPRLMGKVGGYVLIRGHIGRRHAVFSIPQ